MEQRSSTLRRKLRQGRTLRCGGVLHRAAGYGRGFIKGMLETLGVAPTARHALYYLYVLALLVLTLEAKAYPALVAGVGCLVGAGRDFLRVASLA
jgi:hypothetical protein